MKCIVNREELIKSLNQIIHLVVNRPVLPILGNLLICIHEGYLELISTNLEIEIIVKIILVKEYSSGSITVPAKKFFNICRSLPEETDILINFINNKILINAKNSKFFLSTLPVKNFPKIKELSIGIKFFISQKIIKFLIEKTYFAVANQDVRYYLNGMLFSIKKTKIVTVATDGYRLAICTVSNDNKLPMCSIIIPRKSVIELIRLLKHDTQILKIKIDSNNIAISNNEFVFKSKLIDGIFPDYKSVFPDNPDKIFTVDYNLLKKALSRAAIISNERIHGIRFFISNNKLKITSSNTENETYEENIHIIYDGSEIELCFNVNYILDVLNVLKCENVMWSIKNSTSSVQIEDESNNLIKYIIMPMRL